MKQIFVSFHGVDRQHGSFFSNATMFLDKPLSGWTDIQAIEERLSKEKNTKVCLLFFAYLADDHHCSE